jgi:hypothetical protein
MATIRMSTTLRPRPGPWNEWKRPFAAFFYAAFNPFLLFLAQWPATRWLASFFLPHMVLPPGNLLKTMRVAGSVLFVGGTVVFLACAAQVYFHQFLRRGPALGGLYRWMSRPVPGIRPGTELDHVPLRKLVRRLGIEPRTY